MFTVKIVAGCLLFIAGWLFLYRPAVIAALNRVARDTLFNDRLVLLKGRKVAVLCFCVGIVLLYGGLQGLTRWMERSSPSAWALHPTEYQMYMAMQDYCTERYADAVAKYQQVLKAEPGNIEAMKRLAFTYGAMGEKARARALWRKLLRMNPYDEEIRRKLGR